MKIKSKTYSPLVKQNTHVAFYDSISVLKPYFQEANIVLVDKKLKKYVDTFSSLNAMVFYLEGSEKTKSLTSLTRLLDRLFSNAKFELNKKTKLVVIGGGTLGDFGGFLAHIIKRGLELILVPTTWLSAIDSAHGGKNGINYKHAKNQLGTIYPAQRVMLIRSLLESQPMDRTIEGFGELIKIAYIQSSAFYKKVVSEKLNQLDLFSYLPAAIDAKYKVVKQDPFETKGIRYILNFGHTMGHVWEARLGIHHGVAVLLGMYFDFIWASERGYRVGKDLQSFFQCEIARGILDLYYNEKLFSISLKQLSMALAADKKKEDKHVRYVFPDGAGRLKIESVTIKDVQDEFLRQKKLFGSSREFAVTSI